MATPTTALQVQMMMAAFDRVSITKFLEVQQMATKKLFDMMRRRFFLQRPHTDDMMQMLVDMGIDPPVDQPISYDGVTFRWR